MNILVKKYLAIFLFTSIAFILCGCNEIRSIQNIILGEEKTITVTGIGNVRIPADRIRIEIHISTESDNYEYCSSEK